MMRRASWGRAGTCTAWATMAMANTTVLLGRSVVMAIQSKRYDADFFRQPSNVGSRARVFL